MRIQWLIGGVASFGLLLAAAACGGTDDPGLGGAPAEDAGSSGSNKKPGSSGSSGDTDPDDPGDDEKDSGKSSSSSGGPTLKSTTLVQGDLLLLGLAGDDAIYIEFGQDAATLNAVPIAGGTATKIAELGDEDDWLLNGGAVALWTNVDGARGTLNVWTRATGLKTNVAANSLVGGLFRATADGSRIAFTQDATVDGQGAPTSAPVGVRDTAAATNAASLTGTGANTGNALNIAAASGCAPRMSFAGKVFFATFCTGTTANATNAKLVSVADGTTATVVRLDAASGAPALKPVYSADSAGSKVFTIASANSAGMLITLGNTVARANLENDVADGFMLQDGSAVVFRTTGNALKKATTAAAPVVTPIVAADVKGILGASRDNKQVLFNKLDRSGNSPLIDINIVDHTAAAPAAIALVPTLAAVPAGFTGSSAHVVFIGDISQTGAKLKSVPVAGGTAKDLTDTVGAIPVGAGTGVVFASNPSQVGQAPNQFTISDIGYVDAVAAKPSKIADSVPEGEFALKDKRLVYSRFAQQGSGLYAVTLP